MLSLDVIVAPATGAVESAISVIRLSGERAFEVAAKVWNHQKPFDAIPARYAALASVCNHRGDIIDDGLWVKFVAPQSYTGENVVEFSGHGGRLVTQKVMEAFLQAGARLAEPGEFTQRAFLNGKMDLTQAEAVMDLISAKSDLALKSARQQLAGALGQHVEEIKDAMIEITAHVEAYIDFPEEDIDPETGAAMIERMDAALDSITRLLATSERGRRLREGVRIVLAGAPNAGKSSLLNRLLGLDRAIVSPIPGTTRDTVEEVISMAGLPVRLVDTAGLRETGDEVERKGVERTKEQITQAGLILSIVDASQPKPSEVHEEFGESAFPMEIPRLRVLTKCDLQEDPSWNGVDGIRLSNLTGEGIEILERAIQELILMGTAEEMESLIAVNQRHQNALERAGQSLQFARERLALGESSEFVALDLRECLDALGEVTGKIDVEEVLDRVFARFCLGK